MRPLAAVLAPILLAGSGCSTVQHSSQPGAYFSSMEQCRRWSDANLQDPWGCERHIDQVATGQAVGTAAAILFWVAFYAAILVLSAR